MWDDTQALRQLTMMLLGVSLTLVLFGMVHYVVHLPSFPLSTVRLGGIPQRVDTAQIEEIVHTQVKGNFFTVDLERTRKAFEQLPWVRKVSVRRQFPWQLEVDLEEHVALADWNDEQLVNTHGEVFAAGCSHAKTAETPAAALPPCGETDRALPKFWGQPETSAEITQTYRAFSTQLAPLKQQITQIRLSPRRTWQLQLDNGMVLQLGREQADERLARFVAVYPYSLASLNKTVDYVDLRYRNGFAAHLPDGMARNQAKRG